MHNEELVTDKTFFIMNDGDVKTYYRSRLIDGQIQILVYDRTSITGVTPLNTQNLKTILTEYSNVYCNKLKGFIKFLYTDLHQQKKDLLYEYIAHIWNGNEIKAGECYDEDCTLPEQFEAYMQELIDRDARDPDVVHYFHAVYCEQEITYPKYSEEWLMNSYY